MPITKTVKTAILVLFTTIGLALPNSHAGEAEVNAVQSVIDSQIQAFLNDDNATAYSHAAPSIKQMFPSVDAFMEMVTRGYQPVWKPRSYSFGKSAVIDDRQIVQQVMVTGPDGKDYEAVYTLRLQDDGSYKITGVRLREAVSTGA